MLGFRVELGENKFRLVVLFYNNFYLACTLEAESWKSLKLRLNEQTVFDQTSNKVSPHQRFLCITVEILQRRHPDSVSDWLLFPAWVCFVSRGG